MKEVLVGVAAFWLSMAASAAICWPVMKGIDRAGRRRPR